MHFPWLQVETVREKRRREVQFSKAGLEMPHDEKAHTKKKRDDASQNMGIEVPNDEIPVPAAEVGVFIEDVANVNAQPPPPEIPQTEEIAEPMVSNYYISIYFSAHEFISCRNQIPPKLACFYVF